KNADCATRRALIGAFNEELATRRFSMMRTLARRTKAWRARSRTSWTGKRPGTRSVPPPQPPPSGRRRQPQQFFAPTARSSTSGFQHLAATPPLQLAHLATPVRPLGRCPRPSVREELVRGNATAASYQAYRHARLERLLDDPDFSDPVQRRQRLTDVIILTRSA